MSEQPSAVRLQDRLMQLANLEANELAEVMQQAADRIEADEALMRQALDALEAATSTHMKPDRHRAALTTLRSRLKTK